MQDCISPSHLPALSLYDEALREADAFKWLESERCCRDVGHWARSEWVRRYWPTFVRWKRLQHLYGLHRYLEFEDAEFGRLAPAEAPRHDVVQYVMQRFIVDRWENLHYLWRAESVDCTREELLQLLEVIGINRLRGMQPPASLIGAA